MSKQPELRIFDTPNAKLIGQVIDETDTTYIVEWIGHLGYRPEAIGGGAAFKIIVTIQNPLTPQLYELERSGIRGSFRNESDALAKLYDEYTSRCIRGEYHLNPYAPPVTQEMVQGTGTEEAPEGVVNIVNATPEAPSEVPSNAS